FAVGAHYEENDPAVTLRGPWLPNGLPVHSGGAAALAMDVSSSATFAFTGTVVRWLGYRDPWSGLAQVTLDGQLQGTVDTYAATFESQAVLYTLTGLVPGRHTLAIQATGRRHPLSLGNWVWVDAFEIPAGPLP